MATLSVFVDAFMEALAVEDCKGVPRDGHCFFPCGLGISLNLTIPSGLSQEAAICRAAHRKHHVLGHHAPDGWLLIETMEFSKDGCAYTVQASCDCPEGSR